MPILSLRLRKDQPASASTGNSANTGGPSVGIILGVTLAIVLLLIVFFTLRCIRQQKAQKARRNARLLILNSGAAGSGAHDPLMKHHLLSSWHTPLTPLPLTATARPAVPPITIPPSPPLTKSAVETMAKDHDHATSAVYSACMDSSIESASVSTASTMSAVTRRGTKLQHVFASPAQVSASYATPAEEVKAAYRVVPARRTSLFNPLGAVAPKRRDTIPVSMVVKLAE